MSAAGPPQSAGPPAGGRREATVGGDQTSAAGPPQSAGPPGGGRREATVGGDHTSDSDQRNTGESVAGLTEANRVRELAAQLDAWEKRELADFIARAPERRAEFRTLGGMPLKRVYTALDTVDTPLADIGLPGQFPYTRGPYPTMYRGRLWTMRQIAGFGTAEDTNGRFKYLIEHGQTGLSTDFDMPTLMRSEERRVGKEC